MKGFLIGLAVLVVGAIYILTSFGKVGAELIAKVVVEEGGRDAIVQAEEKDPKAFVARYQPLLAKRGTVGRIALWLDEAYFLALSMETLELYADTSLAATEPYGLFMFDRARLIEADASKGPGVLGEAFSLYKAYVAAFPDTKQAKLAQNSINRLTVKYGFQ